MITLLSTLRSGPQFFAPLFIKEMHETHIHQFRPACGSPSRGLELRCARHRSPVASRRPSSVPRCPHIKQVQNEALDGATDDFRRQYRQLLESNDSIPAERYDRLRVGVAQITRELYAKFLRLIAADERIKGACAGNATILRQALKTFDNRLNAELTRGIDAELDKYYSDRSGQS